MGVAIRGAGNPFIWLNEQRRADQAGIAASVAFKIMVEPGWFTVCGRAGRVSTMPIMVPRATRATKRSTLRALPWRIVGFLLPFRARLGAGRECDARGKAVRAG